MRKRAKAKKGNEQASTATNNRHLTEKEGFDMLSGMITADYFDNKEIFFKDAMENKHALSMIGKINGKFILELGCGPGLDTVFLAQQGGRVTAVDISGGMIRLTRNMLEKHNLMGVKTVICPIEKLNFSSIMPESFDLVFGRDVMHHLDSEKTILVVFKALKKNGKAVFVEPLRHNPIVEWVRHNFRQGRTPYENALSLKEIEKMGKGFKRVEHEEFNFFTLLVYLLFVVVEKSRGNKLRVCWWYDISKGWKYRRLYLALQKLDKLFLGLFPFMKKYCLTTVVVLYKQ
ncbi:class I SAM-dependent methyltransferase [Candidatus Woesearchaeota archaeon]|nr:class I SAM-dependent methyltransferase [Candidatus Woesearchaeota archaeon]